MLIRDWFFRIYGDVAHDWRFCAIFGAIVLLVCWLSAEGAVSVGRRTEVWARQRWNRSAKRAARDPKPLAEDTTPSSGEPYPEQRPAPGVLRGSRSARRVLWAQIEKALVDAARNRRGA